MRAVASRLFRTLAPFLGREPIFSIGIYGGSSPLELAPPPGVANPVLTARDVRDVPAHFVADPFMVREGERWHMFFEILNRDLNRGQIGLASSADGLRWRYERLVLAEPFHLSYPYVFAHEGRHYMIPETNEARAVRLYRADPFPHGWRLEAELLTGHDFYDSSIFQHGGRWWIFAGTNTAGNDTLRLYHAADLRGPYVEHPASPVISGNPYIARPAGRVLVEGGRVTRFTQDCHNAYGLLVRAFEVTELTPERYAEREAPVSPVLGPSGRGWNADGMHQIDLHRAGEGRWLACVDGYRRAFYYKGRAMGEAH